MNDNYKLKMAVVAGAAEALKFKEKKRMVSDQEVIQHITNMADDIIRNIEDEGED